MHVLTSPCYLGLKSHRVRTDSQWTLHLKAPLHMSDKGFLSGCTHQKKNNPTNKFKVRGLPNKYTAPPKKKLNSSSQRNIFRPWDSPGKNTGMGCHFLLQCMRVKNESEVAQSCPTLSDPMDCSLPGSSIHGIFKARVLEWGAIAFSIKGL